MLIMNKVRLRTYIIDYLLIIVLAFVYALNYELFVLENDFAPAGVGGIGAMIEHLTNLSFNLGYFTLIVNIPLCIFAFFFITREFAVKTAVFVVVYSLSLIVLRMADLSAIKYDAQGVDTIFPALIAGAIAGFVYGVGFRRNSSTGGSDIIAKYVSIKKPELNFFWINFVINAAIAIASYFVYTRTGDNGEIIYDYKPVCLCMLYCFLMSFVGNMIIKGSKSAYKFFIVTTHPDEIDAEIFEKLHHGATKLQAKGAYSNTDRTVIVCVVNKRQLVEFRNILKKYDDTFAFVETVNETVGTFARVK